MREGFKPDRIGRWYIDDVTQSAGRPRRHGQRRGPAFWTAIILAVIAITVLLLGAMH